MAEGKETVEINNDDIAANEDGSDIFMGQSIDELHSDLEPTQDSTEDDIAANEDGSDIFMGQSIDELHSDLEPIQDSAEDDIADNIEVKSTDENLQEEQSIVEDTNKKESSKRTKFIRYSFVFLIVVLISMGIYYYFILNSKDLDNKNNKLPEVKKVKAIDLTIINKKMLNKKLKILLDDEKDAFIKREKAKEIAPIVSKPTDNIIAIQVAVLQNSIDNKFMKKLQKLQYPIKKCSKQNADIFYILVPKSKADIVCKNINLNIVKDAFISTSDVASLCK